MSKEYVIEVQTGNIDKAGTDADVYTQLYGERAISSELYLDNDKNNFERGKLDQFDNVFADDVGWIDKIRLFHRNNGERYCQMLWMRFVADASFARAGQAEAASLRGGCRSFIHPASEARLVKRLFRSRRAGLASPLASVGG